jgi:protein TonB
VSRRRSPSAKSPVAGGQGVPRVFGAAGSAAAARTAQQSLPLPDPVREREPEPRATGQPRGGAFASLRAGLALDYWPVRLAPMAPDRSVFTYALIASLAVHALVLAIRFHVFDPRTLADRGPPLEVALVNAKSPTKPMHADILAQANLDGGGNTDANRRAKTPLPAPVRSTPHTDIAVTARKAEALERRAQEIITALKAVPVAPAVPPPVEAAPKPELASVADATERTLEIMRLEAQIARDLDTYQKRPKRQHVGARATEYRFARYVEDWRLKVERIGNLNYPEAARQLKLYGSLILTVSIRADGSVENVVIDRSSGRKVLDAAAIHIVQMAAPYAPFPPEIRRDTEILDITRTWTFAPGDELRSD